MSELPSVSAGDVVQLPYRYATVSNLVSSSCALSCGCIHVGLCQHFVLSGRINIELAFRCNYTSLLPVLSFLRPAWIIPRSLRKFKTFQIFLIWSISH